MVDALQPYKQFIMGFAVLMEGIPGYTSGVLLIIYLQCAAEFTGRPSARCLKVATEDHVMSMFQTTSTIANKASGTQGAATGTPLAQAWRFLDAFIFVTIAEFGIDVKVIMDKFQEDVSGQRRESGRMSVTASTAGKGSKGDKGDGEKLDRRKSLFAKGGDPIAELGLTIGPKIVASAEV
ncbi:hypothetical protein HDV00_002194 [Rhizophlyctis rosea]|nr:hypothetical protein HDV00_002194 [Rhizophlyctis rosea]